MIDKCLRCSGACLVKTDYYSDVGNTTNSMISAKVGVHKTLGIRHGDWERLTLYICADCGHSEFILEKEHLQKLKQYNVMPDK